jgi:flagella basal body P-ring formation protein FlgA
MNNETKSGRWQDLARFTVLTLLLALALSAGADTLTLKETAYVKGPKVLLGDVAEIEGVNAEILAGIELTPAAMPGASKPLNAALVEARLRHAGLDTGEISIKGASRVLATTLYAEISKQMIAQSLYAHILETMPWDSQETEIDIPVPLNDLTVPDGEIEFVWRTNPQFRYLGSGAFRGSILVDGVEQRSILCKANIEVYTNVVVARRDIPRGRPIGVADVEMRTEALSRIPEGTATGFEQVIGFMTRKTIFPGQIVSTRNIELPRVVRRNQLVAVEMTSGSLNIQSRAKALSDGRMGDTILCANLNSGEVFQGVVRADGVIEVH